jgi:hypothetical protein
MRGAQTRIPAYCPDCLGGRARAKPFTSKSFAAIRDETHYMEDGQCTKSC